MMFFHNSTLPYQFKIASFGVNTKDGKPVTSPKEPILREFGVFEWHDYEKKFWEFPQSLLLGVDMTGNFEVVSFLCDPKERKTFLVGEVLNFVSHGDEKECVTVFAKAKDHIWTFLAYRDLSKPTLVDLTTLPSSTTLKGILLSRTCGQDLAKLSAPKVVSEARLIFQPRTSPAIRGERGVHDKIGAVESAALVLGGLPTEAILAYKNGEADLFKARIEAAIENLRQFHKRFDTVTSSAA